MPIDDELRRLIDGHLTAHATWFQACDHVVKTVQTKLQGDEVPLGDKVPIPRAFNIRQGRNLLKGEDLLKGLVRAFLFA